MIWSIQTELITIRGNSNLWRLAIHMRKVHSQTWSTSNRSWNSGKICPMTNSSAMSTLRRFPNLFADVCLSRSHGRDHMRRQSRPRFQESHSSLYNANDVHLDNNRSPPTKVTLTRQNAIVAAGKTDATIQPDQSCIRLTLIDRAITPPVTSYQQETLLHNRQL